MVPIRAAVPWALLLGLAIMSPAPAQTPRPAPNADAAVHAEILNLRETIRAAVAAKDRAALERFYADNFIHMRDSGRVDLKGGRIALLLSGASAIETAPEDEFVVQSYGSGTAATGVSRIEDGATDRAARFRWLTVYVRDGADWRVALSQASRIVARGHSHDTRSDLLSRKNGMKAKRAAAGAACILACTLAGCTPGRILDQFDDPEPQKVTLACGEAYKIYEKQQPRRLVVASSLVQEVTRDTCEGFEKLFKHERFAKVAKDHLASTGRGNCKITSVDPLSLSAYAARYHCPKPGEAEETGRSKRAIKRL